MTTVHVQNERPTNATATKNARPVQIYMWMKIIARPSGGIALPVGGSAVDDVFAPVAETMCDVLDVLAKGSHSGKGKAMFKKRETETHI